MLPGKTKPKSNWRKWVVRLGTAALVFYLGLTFAAAYTLPDLLLKSWTPQRTAAEIETFQQKFGADGHWTTHQVAGGENVPITLYWLHRPNSRGVAIHLHGVADDAWGSSSPRLVELPDWDALIFTFRGRDEHPEVFCTLGGWERFDIVAAVNFLESQRIARNHIILVGASMGAGISLLALHELEKQGSPLGGALLESPFRDLRDAARNHVRQVLGPATFLTVPAVEIALRVLGKRGRFEPEDVSPLNASKGLRTPVALVTGDADDITPVAGVREIAQNLPDLTVIPGACHVCAGGQLPGGWGAWAHQRLEKWEKPRQR